MPAGARVRRVRWLPLLLVLLAVGLAACREEQVVETAFTPMVREQAGPPRSFALGFSALPAELTDEAYAAAFDLAANYGDVVLLQRTPSWADFLPGSSLSPGLREATLRDRDAVEVRELKLFIALDPFDSSSRGELANLPEGYEGADLSDPDLRQAFVAEAAFLARTHRPMYMALGTEVNATFERDPDQYASFIEAYREAYDAVKVESPETLVFVTFQYEQLLGIVPWEPPHVPRWSLISDIERQIDILAITSYPSFVFSVARKVPPLYYLQIRDHTELPIAFASTGFSSAAGRDGLNASTPAEQRRFLQRLLADAEQLETELLIWLVGRDLAFVTEPPYDLLASIGLRDSRDRPKEAWVVWEEVSARPYEAPSDEVDGEE